MTGSRAWECLTPRYRPLKSPAEKFHPHPQISGKNGGESLNLHQFSRDGVVLLGHVRDVRDGRLIIAQDVKDTLAKVDQFEADAIKRVDDYVARTGLSVPSETIPQLRYGYDQHVITELDLKSSRSPQESSYQLGR